MTFKFKTIISAVFLFAMLFNFQYAFSKKSGPELIDKVAVVVNNKVITLSELHSEMLKLAPALGFKAKDNRDLLANKDLLKQTLDKMINDILIEEEIKKRGIEVSDPELEMFLRNIMKQNRLKTMDDFKSALALRGLPFDEYRESLRKQIQTTKIMNSAVRSRVNISRQDLKNYYMQHMEEAREPDSIHLKNIFVSKGKKKKARMILDKLRKGSRFEDLVKKYSEDSNAKSGGDLGFLAAKSINPKIYKEVSGLSPGQHTGTIDAANGFYIIKVVAKKRGEIRSFESMKDALTEKLTNMEMEKYFKSWLEELKSRSHIDIKVKV